MHVVIVSGRSGTGKTVALGVLEDLGFYCIDNLPLSLLPDLKEELGKYHDKIAVSLDARNIKQNLNEFQKIVNKINDNNKLLKRNFKTDYKIIYLNANDKILLKRFGETRRKHPLTTENLSLEEALKIEKKLLTPISNLATYTINTEQLSIHKLNHIIKSRFENNLDNEHQLQILVQSFGYKYGLPMDADFTFDVRCLPNPYWQPELKNLTGKDEGIINFLNSKESVTEMFEDIYNFLKNVIPKFKKDNRSYLNIAIGCTGGRHRSVFLTDKIYKKLKKSNNFVLTRHREL